MKSYLDSFRKELKRVRFPSVKEVVILGVSQKTHPDITKIQKNLDRKQTKGDVWVKLSRTGEWRAFSVKANKGVTLTNYSVEKLLINKKELKEIRFNTVRGNNLPTDKMDKKLRSLYSKCFYGENPYFTEVTKSLSNQKDNVIKEWISGMFPDLPFVMYQFEGSKISKIDSNVSPSDVTFEQIDSPAKNPRGSASLFFDVKIKGEKKYLWVIRWKGNVLGSPTLCTISV